MLLGLLPASGARALADPGTGRGEATEGEPLPWEADRDVERLKSRLWELEATVAAIDERARVLHRLADVNLPGHSLEDQLPGQRALLERAIAAVDAHLSTLLERLADPWSRAKLEATLAGWRAVKRGWVSASATRSRDTTGFRSSMELVQWNLDAVRGNVRDLSRRLGVQGLHDATPDRMRPPERNALPPTPEL